MTTTGTADERFGAAVKVLRERRGWSMSEFARGLADAGLSNFHPTTIGRLERGERPIKLSEAIVIADVLDVSLGYMVAEGDARNDLVIPGGRLLPEDARATLLQVAEVMLRQFRAEEGRGGE